ncbi:MAG UNVERIFIED_CONTAM: hypothetical protein LVR18_45445 [Planctomycetaceae bacterium]
MDSQRDCRDVRHVFCRFTTCGLKTKIEFDKPSVPCARGADLSDELLVSTSQNQGCHQFATFDAAIVKRHTKFAFVPKQ